jgi:hypothetical protein
MDGREFSWSAGERITGRGRTHRQGPCASLSKRAIGTTSQNQTLGPSCPLSRQMPHEMATEIYSCYGNQHEDQDPHDAPITLADAIRARSTASHTSSPQKVVAPRRCFRTIRCRRGPPVANQATF